MEKLTASPEVVVLGNVGVDTNVYLSGHDVDWSVEGNGAGDALAVGFLNSHVLEGRSLEESISRGQLAARHCCALRATSDGLITPERLAQLAGRRH